MTAVKIGVSQKIFETTYKKAKPSSSVPSAKENTQRISSNKQ